jgi:uncharacterized membrane protein YeaQ/YmgE (transglycosylase-associated protein family)
MNILSWLLIGLAGGLGASTLMRSRPQGGIIDVGIGTIGAIVAGLSFALFTDRDTAGFDVAIMCAAAFGAGVALFAHHVLPDRA